MLSYPVSFSSAVSIACFFSSYNWNHSLLNIPMLYAANTSKLVKYNEQASETGHFHTKKNWRHFLSCRQFLICSTIFDYNCSDACASIFLFVLILVHLFLLIDLFLSHFTNLLFFYSEGRYLRSMTPQTPLQLHFH